MPVYPGAFPDTFLFPGGVNFAGLLPEQSGEGGAGIAGPGKEGKMGWFHCIPGLGPGK
jgi:hypothetical protein